MIAGALRGLGRLLALGGFAWAVGTCAFDFPWPALRVPAAILLAGCTAVLGWWLTLRPSNDRTWQPDVAQTAWAEINGDEVTLHNVRNCDYRAETDYTPRWETRTVRLSQITGIDIGINYGGSPWMAHPIASFQFADAPPLCFSIETRKEIGESYSAIGGLYRQYELIYIVADDHISYGGAA